MSPAYDDPDRILIRALALNPSAISHLPNPELNPVSNPVSDPVSDPVCNSDPGPDPGTNPNPNNYPTYLGECDSLENR